MAFILSSPELKPNRITDNEDKKKSSIEFSQPELLLIADKKMRIYSSASIAANPMLPAAPFYQVGPNPFDKIVQLMIKKINDIKNAIASPIKTRYI